MERHSFTRVTLDVRAYQRALSERGVIAARGLVSTNLTGETGSTPFYLQHSLGGSATLRSFHSYRFADLALAHATVEYRWRAHKYVEVAPFFDVGTVAPALSRLSIGALKTSSGVGIRAWYGNAGPLPASTGPTAPRGTASCWTWARYSRSPTSNLMACPLS